MNDVSSTNSQQMAYRDIRKNMQTLGTFEVGDKPLMCGQRITGEKREIAVSLRRWWWGALNTEILEKTFDGAHSILRLAKSIDGIKQKNRKKIENRAHRINLLTFAALCGTITLWETYHLNASPNANKIAEITNRILPLLMHSNEAFYPEVLDRFKKICDCYFQEGNPLAQQLKNTYDSYNQERVLRYKVVKVPAHREKKVQSRLQTVDVKPVPRSFKKNRRDPQQEGRSFKAMFQKSLARIKSSMFKLNKNPHQPLPTSKSDSHINYFNTEILMRARGPENKTKQLSDTELNGNPAEDEWNDVNYGNNDQPPDGNIQFTRYVPLKREDYLPSHQAEKPKEAMPGLGGISEKPLTAEMSREKRAKEAEKILAIIKERRKKVYDSSSSEE